MAQFNAGIAGFRVQNRLISGLEQVLAPDALSLAEERVAAYETYAVPTDPQQRESQASFKQSAEEDLAAGGTLTWSEFHVTDEGGITRGRSNARAGDSDLPSVEGAARLDIQLHAGWMGQEVRVWLTTLGPSASVMVVASDERITGLSARVVSFLEGFVDEALLPTPPAFKVFVGHGGDPQWKYLYRALNDTHGILAEAFESSERAGYHTLVVVEKMVRSSAVAVVVLTGELQDQDGSWRARENVVHEVGFCQGALGIQNTIVVLEEGVSEPSNIAGLTQIRFPKGGLNDVEMRIVEALEERRKAYAFEQE